MHCDNCGKTITSSWDAFEERLEFRRLAKLTRERTWRLRLLCRPCAVLVWRQHDNPEGVQQAALFSDGSSERA